jgi:carbon-monoxide dehydrogenase medium subunit
VKPAPFRYHAPETLEEALALLAEHGSDAKPLAGGQSLVPAMNFRLARPAVLVDLNRIPGLAAIEPVDGAGGLHLGAMTRQRAAETSPLVAGRAPLLAEALPLVAHPQIRNRGTVGGSLAHADPAAELPAVAVTLGVRLRAASAAGERTIDASEFFTGLMATALEPEELLIGIEIPPQPPRSGWSFMELARRHGDYALIGVAAGVTLDESGRCADSRIVLVSAGEVPVAAAGASAALAGAELGAEAARAAAEAAAAEADPPGDIHASADYRRQLIRVLVRRALETAFARACAAAEAAP